MKLTINHVLGKNHHKNRSPLNQIVSRYTENKIHNISEIISQYPIKNADLYHYHRPNIESQLNPNSIATLHFDPRQSDQILNHSCFWSQLRLIKGVHCLNSLQQKLCIANNIDNHVVIPHGFDDKVIKNIGVNQKNNEIIRFGIFSNRHQSGIKGDRELIKLIQNLPSSKFAFYFVGIGWKETINISTNNVYYIKPKNYKQLISAYQLIDALLIYSYLEGGPGCLPEAIALNKLIFSTNVGMVFDFKNYQNFQMLTGLSDVDTRIITQSLFTNKHLDSTNHFHDLLSWTQVSHRIKQFYFSVQTKITK